MEVDGNKVSARLASKLVEALTLNAHLEVAVETLQIQVQALQQSLEEKEEQYQAKHLEVVPDET